MFDFLKKLSGGGRKSTEQIAEAATQYKDYSIVPSPREEAGGWTTEGTITRVIDGQTRTHRFIRADKSGTRDGAVELTLNKCRQTIDQLGDKIFS